MLIDWDQRLFQGLTESEVIERRQRDGLNELPSAKPRSLLAIAWDVVREPMLLLLVAGGIIYLFLGDVREALMLLAFVFVVMGISFYQERKTERALEALRDLSSPRALVIRDGVEKRIAGREVVRGDIVVLAEGDRVPADGVLLSGNYIEVDESLLTGESVAVQKRRISGKIDEIHQPENLLYSGTVVIKGKGVSKVLAIGTETELGKIGRVLGELRSERTRLHVETTRMVRLFATGGLFLCAVAIISYGLTRGHWLDGLLAGITLAMAILPEEFPVVLSIFLALGAWRIGQKRVLTRHVPAVETLGAATVLCVDKTGTLTQNRMSVRKIFTKGHFFDITFAQGSLLPELLHEIIEYSILASQIDPFDPMEKAFRALGEKFLANTEHIHQNWLLEQEYPLSQELLAMSHVWKSPDSRNFIIAAKGAPEAIADLCHFTEAEQAEMARDVSRMAREGLRILAVARAEFKPAQMPEIQHDFDFRYLGLIGLEDPVRPSVPAAIEQCYSAGVRVVMITGDYPETAKNIAAQIGLRHAEDCITGHELDAMSQEALAARVGSANIFARVVPEQKLRLVEALKSQGEIVAMTGDGVNDAPALKAANIGIAMGSRGTDVAREAADLVLLDDDFSSIVEALKLGRRIFDNLRKAIAYILAIHVPIAGLSLIPVLFRWPLVLEPVHIVFLELVIDPACSIVFENEPEECNVMNRPPRDPRDRLFSPQLLLLSVVQGLFVLAIVISVFGVSWYRGQDADDARTLTFTALIIANLCLIVTNRSWSQTIGSILRTRNKAMWFVVGGALSFLVLVLYVPWLQDLFHFDLMHPGDIGVAVLTGGVSIIWFELLKSLWPGLRMESYIHAEHS